MIKKLLLAPALTFSALLAIGQNQLGFKEIHVLEDNVMDGEIDIVDVHYHNEYIYAAGVFDGIVDFDPSAQNNLVQATGRGGDKFIAKYTSDMELVWVKQFSKAVGGFYKIYVNDQNIFVVGSFFERSNYGQYSSSELTTMGDSDVFLLKLDLNGNYINSKSYGSVNFDFVNDIEFDNQNIYISGKFLQPILQGEIIPNNINHQPGTTGSPTTSYLFKISHNFELLNSYFSENSDPGTEFEDIELNNDKVILTGREGYRISIKCLNEDFSLNWSIEDQSSNVVQQHAYHSVSDDNGNIYTLLQSLNGLSLSNTANDINILPSTAPVKVLIKVDSNGNIIENQTFNGDGQEMMFSNNYLYIPGSLNENLMFGDSTVIEYTDNYSYILKVNPSLDIVQDTIFLTSDYMHPSQLLEVENDYLMSFNSLINVEVNFQNFSFVGNGSNVICTKLNSNLEAEFLTPMGGIHEPPISAQNLKLVHTDNQYNVLTSGKIRNRTAVNFDLNDTLMHANINADEYINTLLKYTAEFEYLWSSYCSCDIIDIKTDLDDNIFIAVRFRDSVKYNDTLLITTDDYENIGLLKLDNEGNLIWWRFLRSELGYPFYKTKIQIGSSGQIYWALTIHEQMQFVTPNIDTLTITNPGNSKGHILKIDQNGILLQNQIIQAPSGALNDIFLNVDTEDKVYIGLNHTTPIYPDIAQSIEIPHEAWGTVSILKYDENLNFLDHNTIYSNSIAKLNSLEFAGSKLIAAIDYKGEGTINSGGDDININTSNKYKGMVVNLNSTNMLIDTLLLLNGNNNESCFVSSLYTDSNSIIIIGQYIDILEFENGVQIFPPEFSEGSQFYYIAWYDENFELQFSSNELGSMNTTETHATHDIKILNNEMISVGRTEKGLNVSYTSSPSRTVLNRGVNAAFISKHQLGNSSNSSITIDECPPIISPSGEQIYFSSGTYYDIVLNEQGCDSIIEIHLTTYPLESYLSINLDSVFIENFDLNSDYWILDCQTNTVVPNNEDFYSPNASSSIALIQNNNGCIDTTDCIDFIYLNTSENELLNDYTIYPTLISQGELINTNFDFEHCLMIDLSGKATIVRKNNKVPSISKGMYSILFYRNNDLVHQDKIIIQ